MAVIFEAYYEGLMSLGLLPGNRGSALVYGRARTRLRVAAGVG